MEAGPGQVPRRARLLLGDESAPPKRRRCAFLEGFSLHADTWVHENDRDSLERLCRYGARGPLALERLTRREDGRPDYRLKKPSHGGDIYFRSSDATTLSPKRS